MTLTCRIKPVLFHDMPHSYPCSSRVFVNICLSVAFISVGKHETMSPTHSDQVYIKFYNVHFPKS